MATLMAVPAFHTDTKHHVTAQGQTFLIVTVTTIDGGVIRIPFNKETEQRLARQLNAHFAKHYYDDWSNNDAWSNRMATRRKRKRTLADRGA